MQKEGEDKQANVPLRSVQQQSGVWVTTFHHQQAEQLREEEEE